VTTNNHVANLVLLSGWLVALGCEARRTDPWISDLRDPDPKVRRAAAESLGKSPTDTAAAVPALKQALTDKEDAVRLAAALALARLEPNGADYPPVLIAALEAGPGPVVIEVGRLGPGAPWAVPTLIQLLTDSRPQVRGLAAATLGAIGLTPEVSQALEARLRDPEEAVRRAAQRALRRNNAPAGERSEARQ